MSPTAKTSLPELPQTPLSSFPCGSGFCHSQPSGLAATGLARGGAATTTSDKTSARMVVIEIVFHALAIFTLLGKLTW